MNFKKLFCKPFWGNIAIYQGESCTFNEVLDIKKTWKYRGVIENKLIITDKFGSMQIYEICPKKNPQKSIATNFLNND